MGNLKSNFDWGIFRKLNVLKDLVVAGAATITGAVTATGGFVGNLTGNVTGNVSGNLTGGVTGTTATFSGDVTLGDAAADTTIIKSRLATTSVAGAALDLGATYDKGEWAELRPRVTAWDGIGTQFNGLYLRAETTADCNGGSLRGAEIMAVANGADIDDLKGALINGYVKGDTAETSTQVVGIHAEIGGDAGRANATTLTQAAIGLFKLLAWKVADYTKFHGLRLLFGDMDGGSRTFGSGIQLLDDPDTAGTSVLTNVIESNLAAANFLKVSATGQAGVTITDAWNTEQAAADLAGTLTIDVNGTPYYINLYTSQPTTI